MSKCNSSASSTSPFDVTTVPSVTHYQRFFHCLLFPLWRPYSSTSSVWGANFNAVNFLPWSEGLRAQGNRQEADGNRPNVNHLPKKWHKAWDNENFSYIDCRIILFLALHLFSGSDIYELNWIKFFMEFNFKVITVCAAVGPSHPIVPLSELNKLLEHKLEQSKTQRISQQLAKWKIMDTSCHCISGHIDKK